jgi:hypothetical protein
MTQDVQMPDEFIARIYATFSQLGEIQENGLSYLKEVTVSLPEFRVIIRTNESQHRGRPHCLIAMGENSATFDIQTGQRLAGNLKSWNRTAEKPSNGILPNCSRSGTTRDPTIKSYRNNSPLKPEADTNPEPGQDI